jgi:hypothetical protein
MGRKKKLPRLAVLETLRDGAIDPTLGRPDYRAAVQAEELVLKSKKWELEEQLLKSKIQEGKAKASIAQVRAKYAERLIQAEILERQSIARQEYIKAKEAKRKEGSDKPPAKYANEFSPEETVGAHQPLPKTTGSGRGDLP